MSVSTVDIQALKDAHRRTWASGDYARIAELVTDVGERVVERAGVRAGSDVLDVAAGTGNASIPAARAGAHVIATDLTPELFTTGRRRDLSASVAVATRNAARRTTTRTIRNELLAIAALR